MKKSAKIFLSLTTIILFAIFAIGSSESNEPKTETNDEQQTENNSEKYIPGIMPVDVYMNFEKIGFSTNEQLNPEYGNIWTNKSTENGIEYTVETYSDNIENVISIRATAMVNGNTNINATKQFFKFIAYPTL